MTIKPLFWVLCITAVAATGCSQSVNSVEHTQPQAITDKRIENDPLLAERARITGVHETMVGDLVKVQVELLNSSSFKHEINYRFEWFDDAGMLVESPMSVWKPQTLLGGESVSLVSVAPNARAKDFRLKLELSHRD